MKKIALLTCVLMVALSTIWITPKYAQGEIIYNEHFTDGELHLNWFPGWMFTGCYDSIDVVYCPGNPSGDGWIGRVMNEDAMVATSLAGEDSLKDYCIEAYIYTKVTDGGGGWHGIVARTDTADDTNFYFYLLMCDFDFDKRIRLSHNERAIPHEIREWKADEIPGGVPEESSWHKLRLKITGEQTIDQQIWTFFDDVMLPGCPYSDPDPIPGTSGNTGFFGVWVLRSPGVTDTTLCDDIVVSTGIMDDICLESIISPLDTVTADSAVIPEAVVKNVGDYNEIFDAICRVDSSGVETYADTVSVNLLKPDSSYQVSFAPWTPRSENMNYQIFFWTTLPCDDNPSNDTLSTEVTSLRAGIEESSDLTNLPEFFHLYQNYPNPFNPTTELRYALPKDCWVKLEVYNLLGQKVATLIDQPQGAGFHRISWEAKVPSGVYFYRLEVRRTLDSFGAGEYVATKKMLLLR